jgi:hypothetical protein
LFGLVTFGSVTSHYYAVFSLIPFGLATLSNIRKEKLPPKLIAGALGAVAGLAFMVPLIQELHRLGADFWAQPSIGALEGTFAGLFPHAFLLLPAMLIWVGLCAPDRVSIAAVPMSAQERLAWSFLFIPCGGFLAAKFVSHAFFRSVFHRHLTGYCRGVFRHGLASLPSAMDRAGGNALPARWLWNRALRDARTQS